MTESVLAKDGQGSTVGSTKNEPALCATGYLHIYIDTYIYIQYIIIIIVIIIVIIIIIIIIIYKFIIYI